MVMRNPEPIETIEVKEIVETKSAPPVVEESTNGEQPDQPPVMEEPAAAEPDTAAATETDSASSERLSALAVVSVMSSLIGFLGITSLLGLGLGIVALRQMAVNPNLSGRHLAILGVCLSVFWLVLLVAMGSFLWVGLALVKALFNAIF